MMSKNEKNSDIKETEYAGADRLNYFSLDFAEYRLSSLAEKIKSECLRFKKQKQHFIIP